MGFIGLSLHPRNDLSHWLIFLKPSSKAFNGSGLHMHWSFQPLAWQSGFCTFLHLLLSFRNYFRHTPSWSYKHTFLSIPMLTWSTASRHLLMPAFWLPFIMSQWTFIHLWACTHMLQFLLSFPCVIFSNPVCVFLALPGFCGPLFPGRAKESPWCQSCQLGTRFLWLTPSCLPLCYFRLLGEGTGISTLEGWDLKVQLVQSSLTSSGILTECISKSSQYWQ